MVEKTQNPAVVCGEIRKSLCW